MKRQGSYDSLAAAMAATRYQMRWVERPALAGVGGAWQAANAAQGLQAFFTPGAVHIAQHSEPAASAAKGISARQVDHQPAWQFGMKLTGYGYGDRLSALSDGTVTTKGTRVELARTARSSCATITEWYVNDAAGLEQGFTLVEPPQPAALKAAGEKLRLRLALTGDLKAQASSDGQSVALLNRRGAQVLTYGGLVVRDALARKLEAWMTVVDGEVVIEADDAGAVYPIVIDPTFTQFTKLTASDGTAFDAFGYSMALSGDTALIGVAFDDIGGNTDQGSAYVFVRSGTTWTQQQKLNASDGATNDLFGNSVALSGDTALIGAYDDDIGGNTDQGSAYVFVRTGTTWIQQQKLMDSDGATNDSFGRSVALSGDTALIGADGDEIGGNSSQGSAYVFTRAGTTWTQQQKLLASDGAASDQFGISVALGSDTALIGAYGDDIGGNVNQGSAYVFVRTGATWTQQQKLTASDGAVSDYFGNPVALSGDTALIGAQYDDIGGNADQGSAYVFARAGTTWTQQQKLTASDGVAGDLFGISVALSNDTALVGASGDDISGNVNQGSAYLFSGVSTFPQQARLIASDGAGSDNFGRSVALSGDTAVVGAEFDDFGGNPDRGSAYVFVRSGTTWTQQQQLVASDGLAGDHFGISVALSGDTAIVGAWFDIIGGNVNQGSAYVFVRSGTTWTQQQKLSANDGATNDLFGVSVAVSGDTALVGAFGDTLIGNTNQGSAYVFVRSGVTWTQQQKLTASDGVTNDNFGVSVVLGGDTALIGAYGDDISGNADQGSVYVFARTGTTWTQQQQLTASDGAASDNFGVSVAMSGDTAVIGSFSDDINGNANQGSAYVFVRSGTAWAQQQKLFAGDGAAEDRFGNAVALSGTTALVAAYFDDIGGIADQGSAYVFGTNCPVITISPATLPAGTAANPYSQTLTGNGGAPSYSFTIATGTLPNGVTLTSGGLLSGTPTSFGPFNFTVRTTDNNGCQGTQAYTLTINPPCGAITVNPATLPNGAVGTAYNQTATAAGGTPAYTFTVSEGSLLGGLTLLASGALTGTPNISGVFNFTIKATDANGCFGTRAYSVTVNGAVVNNGLQFYPLPRPVRLLDTRANQGNCDNVASPIAAGTSITTLARVTCESITIPPAAQAIVGNITVLNGTSQTGFLTIYPSGQPLPLAANMIYGPGAILSNGFTVGLGANGQFNVFGEHTIDVVVDVSGYYAPPQPAGLYYHPLPKPIRLFDTRAGQGNCDSVSSPIPAGTSLTTQARVTCESLTIPASAQAIVGNATVINGSGQVGYLTIYPNGVPVPLAANIIYFPGQVLSNAFTTSLSANGEFNIFGERTIDMAIDVAGYYSTEANDVNGAGLLFTPLARPLRIMDTRANQGNCDNVGTPIGAGTSISVPARINCESITIPAVAQAVIGTVTVINPNPQAGFMMLYPDGVPQPLAANMVYFPGQILSNAFVVGLNTTTGQFRVFGERTIEAIMDVSGYFAP